MLKSVTAVCAVIVAGMSMIAQAQTPDAEKAVRTAELKRFAAMTAHDMSALASLLGDDLVYTHSNALVDSKASYLESMRGGDLKYHTIEPREMSVRVYGTSAIITAAATLRVTSKGVAATNQLRYTDVWVLRDGRWQMVSWQSTRIP